MKNVIVNENDKGKRLDIYIAENFNELSRTMIKKLIESNNILVNDKSEKVSYKVQANDNISIDVPEAKETKLKAQEIPLDIIYEDSDIIVVNKPKGMVVHPANGNPDGTLVNAILSICKNSLSGIGGELRPGIVHRLDKDTSGIVIFAKNEYIQEFLVKEMKKNTFFKEYIAVCEGIFESKIGTINLPIGRKENSIIERCVCSDGDIAITHYNVLKSLKNTSVVHVTLETGRTHQIRVHLSNIGHPILGDTLYGNPSSVINRQALHAYKVKFIHPITGLNVEYIATIPSDIKSIIK